MALAVTLIYGAFFAALAVTVGYLLLLTGAAFLAPTRANVRGAARSRFALLVPAHNEEAVIGDLMASLQALDYPQNRYQVFVVADNCTDATAEIARKRGARVYERHDTERRGKGYALQWLLEQIHAGGEQFDAYVIFDADSRVAPAFLRVMEEELARGHRALQAHYGVLNPGDGSGAALRYAAMALVNYLRPLGKNRFGFSTGLKGNGMCFAADVIREHGWGAHSLAEDAEFGVRLLLAGVPVRFVPGTSVWAQMPPQVRQSQSQNMRWEAGRILVVRELVPLLVRSGLRKRDAVLLEAAFDLLVPPLSILVAGCAVLLAGAWLLPWLSAARVAAMVLTGGLALHVLAGLARAAVPRGVWRALLWAPGYCVWKLSLYGTALVRRPPTAWVRTKRFP